MVERVFTYVNVEVLLGQHQCLRAPSRRAVALTGTVYKTAAAISQAFFDMMKCRLVSCACVWRGQEMKQVTISVQVGIHGET